MCDLATEKQRIDVLLAWAMSREPVRYSCNDSELAGYGLAVLREYYGDECPDDCIRKRCEEFANMVARSRRLQQSASVRPSGITVR
jgi:hypothetical protein